MKVTKVGPLIYPPVVILGGERGKLCFTADPHSRAKKMACPAVCLLRHDEGDGKIKFIRGVGVLYPDVDHLYFGEIQSPDVETFWRSMYATSLTSAVNLSDHSVQLAILIADERVLLDDPRLHDMQHCMSCGYTLQLFREQVLQEKIPKSDLKKIIEGFKFWGAALEDPITEVSEEIETAYGIFEKETFPMALAA